MEYTNIVSCAICHKKYSLGILDPDPRKTLSLPVIDRDGNIEVADIFACPSCLRNIHNKLSSRYDLCNHNKLGVVVRDREQEIDDSKMYWR